MARQDHIIRNHEGLKMKNFAFIFIFTVFFLTMAAVASNVTFLSLSDSMFPRTLGPYLQQQYMTNLTIPLKGINDYSNSINMDIPIRIENIVSGFDTDDVYKVAIKSDSSTIFVYLKSYDAALPIDPLNVSADTNIGYFQS